MNRPNALGPPICDLDDSEHIHRATARQHRYVNDNTPIHRNRNLRAVVYPNRILRSPGGDNVQFL